MLLIFDFVFLDDIETVFDLSRDYFEIEYCLDGYIYIQEENRHGIQYSLGKGIL